MLATFTLARRHFSIGAGLSCDKHAPALCPIATDDDRRLAALGICMHPVRTTMSDHRQPQPLLAKTPAPSTGGHSRSSRGSGSPPDQHNYTGGASGGSGGASGGGRPKRTLIESACSACRKRKSRVRLHAGGRLIHAASLPTTSAHWLIRRLPCSAMA